MTFNKNTKIWSGPKKASFFNPHLSLGAILLELLRQNPNKVAQINENNGFELTNSELRLLAIQAAQQLQQIGLQKDDVIGFVCKNSEYLAPILIASFCIGTPVNGLDPKFSAADISHMFSVTTPKLVFCDDDNIETVREALNLSKLNVLIFNFGEKVDGACSAKELFKATGTEDLFEPIDIIDGTKQVAAIVCSSGTTGASKGVNLSHASLADQNFKSIPLTHNDVLFCYSSIYWITGLASMILGTQYGCTRLITTTSFTADSCLQIIQKYKVTTVIAAPSQLAFLLQSNLNQNVYLESIQTIYTGGAFVSSELTKRLTAKLTNGNVFAMYGLSEATGMLTRNALNAYKVDSVGKLMPTSHVKIMDENGALCSTGEDGEILVKTLYPFCGYYRNEEATKDTITDDGWVCTGDIGHFDDNCFLHIVDRKKDIMKCMSYQISPSEIENVVLKHKGVANVCVVPIPDSIATDLPAALIIKNNKCDVTEEEIINLVKDGLSSQKQIRGGVYFVESFPMTPSGKVLRRKVKEIALELFKAKHS